MPFREVDRLNVFTVQMDGNLILKRDYRQNIRWLRRNFRSGSLSPGSKALAHVLLGNNWRLLRKEGITAGVIAVPMRVQHEPQRLVGDALKSCLDFRSKRRILVVDDHDAVVACRDANISSSSLQHVNRAGNFLHLDLNFAEILLSN